MDPGPVKFRYGFVGKCGVLKNIKNLTGTFIKLWSWGYVIFTQTDIFKMRN